MSNGQTVLIDVRGLHKTFFTNGNRVDVLKGLDLIVKKAETIAIVGASGVGKSTLLHIMGTLERPTKGTIYYRHRDVFLSNEYELARFRNRKIGFVFQFHHLLPEFNALENVMTPMLIGGVKKSEATDRAEEMLYRVGLKDRLRHRIGELSGGEQQRVAVARSLVFRPEVVLADEPTGNLDGQTGGEIHDLLLKLNKEEGVTVVVVTHNLDLACKMETRVRLMDGKAWPER